MIRWTQSGAVEQPTMLQIRVQRAYPGRVRAGAPVPTRSMSTEELHQNLHYFTEGKRGPRTHPCLRLVFSGVGVASRADVPDAIRQARQWGIENVVLHAGVEDLESLDVARLGPLVDCLVVPVQPGPGGASLQEGSRLIRQCGEHGLTVVANTVLTPRALSSLEAIARTLIRVKPKQVALTYPFPISGPSSSEVARIGAVVRSLSVVVPMLKEQEIEVSIKGLPACYLPNHRGVFRKSANRWYVDADHQKQEAILFYPDVVSFTKAESCRFCEADQACDGFFATYLRRDGFPKLKPIGA